MFDPFNPTPREIELILQVKQARLVELEKLDRWTEFEAEDAIGCTARWSLDKHQWVRDSETLIRLASNARMPDEVAQRLQRIIAGWEFTGRPDSWPIAFLYG